MDWLGTITEDTQVQLLTTVSLICTAGFGLLALLTDYKVDGRITRWGKIAAGGIVLSAILSMLSGIVQSRIDAAKTVAAAAQAQRDSEQFKIQLDQLRTLKRSMTGLNAENRRLQASMQKSADSQRRVLTAQSTLLSKSEQSMLLTARLTGQEDAHTAEVLKSLWFGINRIEASRVELMASVDCELDNEKDAPAIFAERTAAWVMLAQPGKKASLGDIGRTMFSYSPQFSRMGVEGGQTMTWFRGFQSFSPEEIADPEGWRHARATIGISGAAPAGLTAIKWRKGHALTGEELPCEATYMLMANGHMIGSGTAPLKLKQDHGEQIVAMEDDASIEDSSLPRYLGR